MKNNMENISWIPVTTPPDDDRLVLGCVKDAYNKSQCPIIVYYGYDGKWHDEDDDQLIPDHWIDYWMDIPDFEEEIEAEEDSRPSASERLDLLRARIRDAVKGYDPFRVRTRNAKAVAWRQCVYLLLKNEGYTLHAIADASGYNHATIAWGIKHAKDLVDIGDSEYKRIWNELNYIDEGWR